MWNKLLDHCGQTILSEEPDKITWLLTKSGNFSIKSMYMYLSTRRVLFPYKMISRLSLPLKIKAFIWLSVKKKKVLTKDNLIKRGWKGSRFCEFCGGYESLITYFFIVVCRGI
jgi:hypothetical protein